MRLLQKQECINCDEQFLVDKDRAAEKELKCPFCGEVAIPVAEQNPDPDEDLEDQLGCLWPGGGLRHLFTRS